MVNLNGKPYKERKHHSTEIGRSRNSEGGGSIDIPIKIYHYGVDAKAKNVLWRVLTLRGHSWVTLGEVWFIKTLLTSKAQK